MEIIKYSAKLRYFSTRQKSKGAIHIIASLLRRLAETVDNQKAIIIDFSSSHQLSNQELAEVVKFGMQEMEKGFVETVKSKAVEDALKREFSWTDTDEIY